MGQQSSSGIGTVRSKTPSPGGSRSPQRPGQTPDRSTLPGEMRQTMPRAIDVRRPLSQYGTAEEIMQVFQPGSNGIWAKDDFEQTGASNEEMRKANPAELTPTRPVPGFALGTSAAVDRAAMLEAGQEKQ